MVPAACECKRKVLDEVQRGKTQGRVFLETPPHLLLKVSDCHLTWYLRIEGKSSQPSLSLGKDPCETSGRLCVHSSVFLPLQGGRLQLGQTDSRRGDLRLEPGDKRKRKPQEDPGFLRLP